MPARSTHACHLAANIVRDFCGDIVASVSTCLLEKGRQNFRELLRNSTLPAPQLREALLVLTQLNLVACHKVAHEGFGSGLRTEYVYEAEIERMLQILRKPWLLVHIRDEMSELAEYIIEGLVENGRLRHDQIVSSVGGKMGKSAESIQDNVLQMLVSLIRAHYVERSPPCDLPLMPTKPHPESVKRKSAKALREEAEQEAWIINAHGVYQQDRFRLPENMLSKSMDVLLGEELTGKKKSGEKRKRNNVNGADQTGDGINEEGILWRVNYEEFNRAFRHQACVDIVEAKLDRNAGFALKCMLEATRASESKVNEPVSRQVSEAEIAKAADQLSKQVKDTPDDLTDALESLREDQLEFVTCVGHLAAGDIYVVNLERIIECTQLVEVETAIRDRFGIKGLRIFRLLLLRRQLEHKQVADLAMLDSKEAWTLLYKMLKAGYVHMQDVPRGQDHAASRTFYTWSVSLEEARRQFVDDLFRGMHNCHCRLMHELRKGKELLELLEIAQGGNETLNITDSQRKSAARLSQTVRTLEVQLLRLDHLTAVMCDFAQ